MAPEERVERNLRGLPGIRVDELLTLRSSIAETPIASQTRAVTHSINSQSTDARSIFHSVSGTRMPHIQSEQKVLKITENATTLLELSAGAKPDLNLIPKEVHHIEDETYFVTDSIGAVEDPFTVPEIIRTKNRHRTGTAAHTSWSNDLRHRAYTSFPTNAPRLNSYYEDQEANQQINDKEDESNKIPTDVRIKTAACQPCVPRFVSFTFNRPGRTNYERRRRLCRSASTIFNAYKAAASACFDPSSPTKHYTKGSLQYEENLAYCDQEDQESGQRMTLKSGLLPGLAVSPARYSNIDVALVDNGAMLPVLCQSIRVKTSLALPTRDGKCLNFVVVKHTNLDGAKPASKDRGAVMTTMLEVPIKTILAGLLNACRTGALNLETLKFVNNQRVKDAFNVTMDGRNFEEEKIDTSLIDDDEEEDEEPSL